jgi:hypothetical protein
MKRIFTVFAVLGLVLALAPAAQAAPIVVPPDGTTRYRIAFQTIVPGRPTHSTIAWYNAFVTAAATNVPALAALNTTWYCIGSTTNTCAKTNTSALRPADPGYDVANDVPIYTTDGRRIADNNTDLWDGSIQSPIRLEDGTEVWTGGPGRPAQNVWTGTKVDGTSAGDGSGVSQDLNALGTGFGKFPDWIDDLPNHIVMARGGSTDGAWINANSSGHAGLYRHFLALSAPIVGVPTPGTLVHEK